MGAEYIPPADLLLLLRLMWETNCTFAVGAEYIPPADLISLQRLMWETHCTFAVGAEYIPPGCSNTLHKEFAMDELPSSMQRKSPRLKGYDYGEAGYYFVTICSYERRCIFGKVEDTAFIPSQVGQIASECWRLIPQYFPLIRLDQFVLMPNHLHGIIQITDSKAYTLSTIIGVYKAAVTRSVKQGACSLPVWQRSFYDRIIRSERALLALRQYIEDNPTQWHVEEHNPSRF